MKIRKLINIQTIVLALALAGLSMFTHFVVGALIAKAQEQGRQATALSSLMKDVNAAQSAYQTSTLEWKNILIRGEDAALFAKHRDAYRAEAKRTKELFLSIESSMKALALPTDELSDLVKLQEKVDGIYESFIGKWTGKPGEALEVDKQVRQVPRAAIEAFVKFSAKVNELNSAKIADKSSEIAQISDRSKLALYIAAAISVVGLSLISFAIGRRVYLAVGAEPADLAQAMAKLAAGDLTQRITSSSEGSLASEMAKSQDMLRDLVGKIMSGSRHVSTKSSRIDQAVHGLKEVADMQSAQSAGIASSMEQLSASANLLSDTANKANQLAVAFKSDLQDTSTGLGAALSTIEQISGMSTSAAAEVQRLTGSMQRIDGLAQTIDQVSKQTNLLSLNAAIEAARAGEAGRGFAVVADSVRALAEQTATASKEISDISSNLMAMVSGVEAKMNGIAGLSMDAAAIDAARQSVGTMDSHIQGISQVNGQIDSAVHEQKGAIDLATTNITGIADQISQSARTATELKGISDELLVDAQNLMTEIGHLKT